MSKITEYFDELAALAMVVGCIVLLSLHIDSDVKAILTVAAGYLFGKRVPLKRQQG